MNYVDFGQVFREAFDMKDQRAKSKNKKLNEALNEDMGQAGSLTETFVAIRDLLNSISIPQNDSLNEEAIGIYEAANQLKEAIAWLESNFGSLEEYDLDNELSQY